MGDREPPIVDRPSPGAVGLEYREPAVFERPVSPGACGRVQFRRLSGESPDARMEEDELRVSRR